MTGALRKAHVHSLAAGWALIAALYLPYLARPLERCLRRAMGSDGFIKAWFTGYGLAVAATIAAMVCGLFLLFPIRRNERPAQEGRAFSYGFAVLALAILVTPVPGWWGAIQKAFWPAEKWLLMWGAFLSVNVLFLFVPLLLQAIFILRRSSAMMDAGLIVLLAVHITDGLGVLLGGYTRESLFSFNLMRLWGYSPVFLTLVIVAPWAGAALLMRSRRDHAAYIKSAAAFLLVCVILYGLTGLRWVVRL